MKKIELVKCIFINNHHLKFPLSPDVLFSLLMRQRMTVCYAANDSNGIKVSF